MKKFAFFSIFMLLMLCAAHKNAQAQGVVTGITIGEYNIQSNVVNGYSETVNDYVSSLYYGVFTQGYLYKNLNLLQAFDSGPASVSAIVLTQDPNAVQDTQYDVVTKHWIVCIYYVPAGGRIFGDDFLGFSLLPFAEIPNSNPFLANGPEVFIPDTVYEHIGNTRVTIGYFPPRLDFINPNWGYERGQVDVTLTGHNVDAGNFNTPVRVNVTGGITATVLSINPTTLTARFQVPDNLTGQQQVTITSTHGTSNPLNFIATDRQPQITGISPSSLDPGTTTRVTIDGTDFGANPDVEILGVTGVQYSIVSRSDTRIVVDISVPGDAVGGGLSITVISRGANGTGFLPGPPNIPPRSNPGGVQVRQVTLTGVTAEGATLVTQVSGNQSILHFVTPKGGSADKVTLTASINPSNAGTVNQISWEGATQDTTDKRRATVSKGSAAKFDVKVKISGQVAKEIRVWVVWATMSSDNASGATVRVNGSLPDRFNTTVSAIIDWTATIAPETIITDPDRPDLGGLNASDPPGSGTNTLNGFDLKEGVNAKWDITRRIRQRYFINGVEQTVTGIRGRIEAYPTDDRIGNDDGRDDDEDNDPYSGNIGKLTSEDNPSERFTFGELNTGDNIELRTQFSEFARLEIQGTWYRISDFANWRLHINIVKVGDIQILPVGSNDEPFSNIIGAGIDGDLQTSLPAFMAIGSIVGDDTVVGNFVTSGPNGLAESAALMRVWFERSSQRNIFDLTNNGF
jgi:IPT/TIG domain-containing protein